MQEQTLTPITPAQTSKNRRVAVILSSIVLIMLVAAVAWLVMNLNNGLTNGLPNNSSLSSGTTNSNIVNIGSSTLSSANSVSLSKSKEFNLTGKVFNPFISKESTVTYKGEALDIAKVVLISSDAVGSAADDLTVSTAEYDLTVQVQWDDIDTYLPKNSARTDIENTQFKNLFRLNVPDTDTTNQYTYLTNLRSTNCDVTPEANEQCANSFADIGSEASLLIRCQVVQVTGLAECDKVVKSLRVSI